MWASTRGLKHNFSLLKQSSVTADKACLKATLPRLSFWLWSLKYMDFRTYRDEGMFFYQIFLPDLPPPPPIRSKAEKFSCLACLWVHQWWRTNSSVLKAPFTLWPQSAFASLNPLSFAAAWQLCFTWDLRERWSNFSKPYSSTELILNSQMTYAIDHTCFCTASCPRACWHWWSNTSQTLTHFLDTIA